MRRTLLWSCAVLVLALAGHVVAGTVRPGGAGGLNAARIDRLASGNSNFAFKLYQQLRSPEGNLFLSPYSISEALAMTYAGARGQTERQMARALSFYLPQAELHGTFGLLDKTLASRGQGRQGTNGQPFRLHVANALWGQQGATFLPGFTSLLSNNYQAGLQSVDFAQSESARNTINDWVAKQTENKIPDLVPKGALNASTRLVLTNAVYFNAAWETPFQKKGTSPGPFTLLNGSKAQVDLMHGSLQTGYAARPGVQVVELPYQGRELSMLVLLPDEGRFRDFEKSLTAARVEALDSYLQPTQVALGLPKFKYSSSFSLSRTLPALGMPDAFSPGRADFSGMTGRKELAISVVIHKALVDVNEEGTEAAAATAVIMMRSAAPGKTVQMTVDRPFLFLIRDRATGTVLFLGRVVDPRL